MDLLDAIYATPADDGPRVVYADALMERGDRHGDFVAHQVAHPDEVVRVDVSWVGARETWFRRGFASRVVMVGDPEVDDPAWATVEHIEGKVTDELLFRAPLRSLRSLARPVDWRRLAAAGVVLPALAELVAAIDGDVDPEAARAVCPALRSCTVHAARILPSLLDQIVRFGLDFPTVRVRRPIGDASQWLADHALVVQMIDGGTKWGRIDDLELQAPTGLVHYRWDQLGRAHWGYAVI